MEHSCFDVGGGQRMLSSVLATVRLFDQIFGKTFCLWPRANMMPKVCFALLRFYGCGWAYSRPNERGSRTKTSRRDKGALPLHMGRFR